jgi:hypothetical protein
MALEYIADVPAGCCDDGLPQDALSSAKEALRQRHLRSAGRERPSSLAGGTEDVGHAAGVVADCDAVIRRIIPDEDGDHAGNRVREVIMESGPMVHSIPSRWTSAPRQAEQLAPAVVLVGQLDPWPSSRELDAP